MEFRYPTVIEWSERDKCFIATVPELPGCMADGPTREAAARCAERVIREWIGVARELGRPVPPRRIHDAP